MNLDDDLNFQNSRELDTKISILLLLNPNLDRFDIELYNVYHEDFDYKVIKEPRIEVKTGNIGIPYIFFIDSSNLKLSYNFERRMFTINCDKEIAADIFRIFLDALANITKFDNLMWFEFVSNVTIENSSEEFFNKIISPEMALGISKFFSGEHIIPRGVTFSSSFNSTTTDYFQIQITPSNVLETKDSLLQILNRTKDPQKFMEMLESLSNINADILLVGDNNV